MGQETALARESPSHDGYLDDQRNGIGDGVGVLVHHARLILLESAGNPSVRALLFQGRGRNGIGSFGRRNVRKLRC